MPKSRLLIADDEEGIRESLRLVLEDDYDLTFAKDGQETLDRMGQETYDLVLLDIKMPKLDGLEVLKRLQSTGNTIPVLLLTAYQSMELAKEAVKLGARDYLPKPFNPEEIATAVRGALTHHGSTL